MVHFQQFRQLGYEGYQKLRQSCQHEMQVFEWFQKHPGVWGHLNDEEKIAEQQKL